MIKKVFLGACIVSGVAMLGSCSGNKAQTEAAEEAAAEPTVEYLRLNCGYNVSEEQAAEATELARQLIAASQTDAGEMDYDMYESATVPGKFVIYETWKDQESLDAHSASEHFTTIVPKMQEISPLSIEMFEKVAEPEKDGKKIRLNCMFTAKEGAADQLLEVAKALVAATQANDKGMVDYDIMTSVTRPGHFMIFETWESQEALDAHSASEHFTTLVPQMHDLQETSTMDVFYF